MNEPTRAATSEAAPIGSRDAQRLWQQLARQFDQQQAAATLSDCAPNWAVTDQATESAAARLSDCSDCSSSGGAQ